MSSDARTTGGVSDAGSLASESLARGTDITVARVRLGAAVLALVCALLSLGSGLASLAVVSLGARQGRRSREALAVAFDRVRRVLPSVLALQVAGLATSILASVAYWLGEFWFASAGDDNDTKLALAGVIGAAAVAFGAFRVLRQLRRVRHLFDPLPLTLMAEPLAPEAAPGLFALLRDLVRQQGSVMPDHVVVGAVESFFVTSSPCALRPTGRLTRGLTLHLPLPLLAILDRAELRTVLAHELAHFSGEDTAYSLRFQPVYVGLLRTAAAIAPRKGGLDRVMQLHAELTAFVLQQFDAAVKHWSRRRELEADQSAVASGSAASLATSLLRVGSADALVRKQLGEIQDRPDAAPADLAADLIGRIGATGFGDPARHLEDRIPHPTDTHPPVRQRLEAVGAHATPALLAYAARPASTGDLEAARTLFQDWPGVNRKIASALRSVAGQAKQLHYAHLAGAQAVAGTDLFESRLRLGLGLLVCAVLCAALLACAVIVLVGDGWSDPRGDTAIAIVGVASIAGLLAILFGAGRLVFRGRTPYLTLGPEGIRSPGFEGLVLWRAMRSITVATTRSAVTSFHLAPGAALPRRTGRIIRLKMRAKENAIQFMGLLPKGMTAVAYHELLLRHARAAFAKAELAARDGES